MLYRHLIFFILLLFFTSIFTQEIDNVDSASQEFQFEITRPENMEDAQNNEDLDESVITKDSSIKETVINKDESVPLEMNIDLDKNISSNNVSIKAKSYFSLLLPGLGEYKLGKKEQAKIFFISEAIIWTGFVSSYLLHYKYFDDARGYLYSYGHSPNAWDIPEDSMSMVLNYDSSEFYYRFDESIINRNPDPERIYFWEWESKDHKNEFIRIWNLGHKARVVSYFFAGATVLNRAISFLNSRRIAANILEGKESTTINSKFIPGMITSNVPGILWVRNF